MAFDCFGRIRQLRLTAKQETIPGQGPRERNHQCDLLRIVFAMLVLLSHAPELTDGNQSREILHRLTGVMTFGALGVDGFFLLSGYLIVQSWMADPALFNFLRKRVLRIVPGYLAAVLLSTLAVGLLAPGVEHFFRGLGVHWINSVVLLSAPATPAVFPGRPDAAVNGAMYTIGYEFRCYLLVAVLGLCGLLRRPSLCLASTALMLLSLVNREFLQGIHWRRHVEALVGHPDTAFHLTAVFLVGVCFYLFRERLVFRQWVAVAAGAGVAGCFVFFPPQAELALVVGGGYLLFYFAQLRLPWLDGMKRLPDISYGIYLYGWPVESLWIWFRRGSPWITFVVATIACFGLGWLSWHFVERPALKWKRRLGNFQYERQSGLRGVCRTAGQG